MNSPNPLLMKAYGNEDLYQEKLAGKASFLAPLSMGLLNYGLAQHSQQEAAQQKEEAEILNEIARMAEHQKMAPATSALEYTPIPYSAMTRLASIAAETGSSFAKEAGIGDFAGSLMKGLGGASKGLAQGGVGLLGRGASGALQGAKGAVQGVQSAGVGLKNSVGQVGGWLSQKGSNLEQGMKNWGGRMAAQGQGLATAVPSNHPAITGAAATGAAATGGSNQVGALQRAGLTPEALKWKLPLAGAALGAGYLGYKAVKGVGNYMSQESHPANWGTGSQLAYGVNQYGQPQVGSQF